VSRTIASDTVSLTVFNFKQEDLKDLLRRRDPIRTAHGERYAVTMPALLYNQPVEARCLIRNAASIIVEVDPLTDERIRHYFRLFRRAGSWRIRRGAVLYDTDGLSPRQRGEYVKELFK